MVVAINSYLQEIEPYERKAVMRASFLTPPHQNQPGYNNQTAYISIRTDEEHEKKCFKIPVEIKVHSSGSPLWLFL